VTSDTARPRVRTTLLVVLPVVLACLGMLEIGLRVAGRPPSSNTDGIFEEYGDGAYRLQRNVSRRSTTRSFSCTLSTNAFGLRDRGPGKRDLARPYLAWMGDSATFGNGVDFEESFVGLFGDLAARRGIEVVNLAVGGHHIAEQQDMLREFLAVAPRPPERVIFVFTPQMLALFDRSYHDLMVKEGYLFPRKGWRIPYLVMTLGNASSAYCFFRDAVRKLQYRWMPNSNGGAPVVAPLSASGSPVVAETVDAKLRELDAQIWRAGAEPVYVFLPTAMDLGKPEMRGAARTLAASPAGSALGVLSRHCAEGGIRLVDLSPILQAVHASGRPMTFAEDMHFVPSIHVVIGQALYDQIMGKNDCPSPSR